MDVELGTSPYDAIPFIISKYVPKIPFRIMRIGYDFLVIFIAWIFGGHVQIVTILMALLLGSGYRVYWQAASKNIFRLFTGGSLFLPDNA